MVSFYINGASMRLCFIPAFWHGIEVIWGEHDLMWVHSLELILSSLHHFAVSRPFSNLQYLSLHLSLKENTFVEWP